MRRGMRGTREIFLRIPGNLLEDSAESNHFKNISGIPQNFEEHSGGCSRKFQRMFKKILGNASKDSGECLKRFPGMLVNILGNVHSG